MAERYFDEVPRMGSCSLNDVPMPVGEIEFAQTFAKEATTVFAGLWLGDGEFISWENYTLPTLVDRCFALSVVPLWRGKTLVSYSYGATRNSMPGYRDHAQIIRIEEKVLEIDLRGYATVKFIPVGQDKIFGRWENKYGHTVDMTLQRITEIPDKFR